MDSQKRRASRPGAALRRFKREKGFESNAALARFLGVSYSYLSLYFSGDRTFGAKAARRIAEKTGIRMEELY